MPRLLGVSGVEAIRALERLGFEQVRQRGSLLKKQTPDGTVEYTAPLCRQLAINTLSGIPRQAQVTPKEFIENL